MKKTILISIITSGMLYAGNVDRLEIDQANEIDNSKIKSAVVLQGNTEVYGEGEVKSVKIEKKDQGNVIKDSVIKGGATLDFDYYGDPEEEEYYDQMRDESIVTQGRTKVVDGKMCNVNIATDNVINDGTTIKTSRPGSVKVDQGLTLMVGHGQTFKNGKITTDNTISNVHIRGHGAGYTQIKQGNFLMLDKSAASTADDIQIDTINRIEGGHVGHANIKQAVTVLKDGAVAQAFRVKQENTIEGETEIENYSEISQGVTRVENAKITSLNQIGTNLISDVQGDSSSAIDSKVTQAYIDVSGNSVVSLNHQEHENIMRNVDMADSTVTQDTVIARNDSRIKNFTQKADSTVQNTELDSSRIDQNELILCNSTLDSTSASTSVQNNMVSDSELTNSHLTQASAVIFDSKVMDLTLSEENTVNETTLCNAKVEQGKLVVSKY